MNNPFDYEPSEEMLLAQKRLIGHIESLCDANPAFREEVSKGKMFGILKTLSATQGGTSPSMGRRDPLPTSPSMGRSASRDSNPVLPIEGEMLEKQRGSFLFAFSGQIGGSFTWPGFVPPVFDYLDEDGYFKVHEREITAINKKIESLESSKDLIALIDEYNKTKAEGEADIETYRQQMKTSKEERDIKRNNGEIDEASLIRESQFMKAELHRKKLYWKDRLETIETRINDINGEIRSLKLMRQQKSDSLQRWLFGQFVFTHPTTGEKKNLLEIFEQYCKNNNLLPSLYERGRGRVFLPPSGSGECCEPKLLHYAMEHHLEPVEIGMFWWGESPKQEIRHHLQFYPACSGKCKPIIETLFPAYGGTSPSMGRKDPLPTSPFMGRRDPLPTSPSMGRSASRDSNPVLPIEGEMLEKQRGSVYEDDYLVVVNKPAGMLSVPGKSDRPSVYSILKERYPECPELQMVHRLDMDTSGLLVVAKTKVVHKDLQRQFAEHTIRKEYLAVLSHRMEQKQGTISLPLRPDFDDRPRQIVDKKYGKTAITKYKIINSSLNTQHSTLITLMPLTGRTHQLRVHCAHREGLNNPIKGDRLYGQKADRLYLHASYLEFTHPVTGERLRFEDDLTK